MYKTGELSKLWQFAAQTDVQFNMVRSWAVQDGTLSAMPDLPEK